MDRCTRWIKPICRAARHPRAVVCIAGLVISSLTVVYWVCPSQAHRQVYEFTLLVGGVIGLLFAYWRCHTADKNRKQEQYRIGSALLDLRNRHYVERVAGAARLSDLVKEDPKQYDVRVMKAFEAFLAFPPGFGCQIGGLTAE